MKHDRRLPPLPVLDWKSDGTPVATDMEDVYFSVEDGLEEARAVFLKGCGLPERWVGQDRFVVAELGFGTGLNLLALWQLWKAHRPSPEAKLDFISFEGAPPKRADAARALARWPELKDFAELLLTDWPARARGVQSIPLRDGVTLILHIDPIAAALPNSQFAADAWFLDGFAPAKNEAMWAPMLYPLMLERSQPGAYVGTYTVAGAVRRGLAEAGFEVSKQPGFGRKRERLQAIAPEGLQPVDNPYPLNSLNDPPHSVAVIGGGIGGACMVSALQSQGCKPVLFDKADRLASAASGNRLALLMPRLDAGDTGTARALLASYLTAYRFYKTHDGVHEVETSHYPRSPEEKKRFVKLKADPPLSEDWLSFCDNGTVLHRRSLIIEPHKLIPDLAGGIDTQLGQAPEINISERTVNGEPFDAIILANGTGLSRFPETDWIPVTGRLGQVEHTRAETARTEAIAAGHYALSLGRTRLWGATFEPALSEEPLTSLDAHSSNAAALQGLVEDGWQGSGEINSRAGIRVTTPDKLPIAGPLPDFARSVQQYADVRHGAAPQDAPPLHEGVFLLGGLGARGFTFAPWLAELLTAQLLNRPLPTGRKEAELVSPMRFIFRGLKKRQF